jgi:hypothetical protein
LDQFSCEKALADCGAVCAGLAAPMHLNDVVKAGISTPWQRFYERL